MTFNPAEDEGLLEPFQLPSMVDLVFILLSFFILATQLRTLERDFTSGYQQQGRGASAQDLPSSVPVSLRSSRGGVAITIGQGAVALNDFGSITTTLAKINLPALRVVVAADPSLSIDQVARALDAVLASPMKNVSLSRLNVTTE